MRTLSAGHHQSPELHVAIGHSLQSIGRQQEAIHSYRTAAALRPTFGDAYWSLANLKTYRFPDDEMARMRAAEATPPETRLIVTIFASRWVRHTSQRFG